MNELSNHLPMMENAHLILLIRNFIEPYLINILPMCYYNDNYQHTQNQPSITTFSNTINNLSTIHTISSTSTSIVSRFLTAFMTTTLERLAICFEKPCSNNNWDLSLSYNNNNNNNSNISYNNNEWKNSMQYKFCVHVYKECSIPKDGYQV